MTYLGHPLVFIAMPNPNYYVKIPIFSYYLKETFKSGQYLIQFFRDQIDEHMKDFNAEEEARDYVHA
jgi:hypothetical protein